MPPKPSNTLTEAELRIMRILWAQGESLVSDLVAAMPKNAPLAYTSVLTTVRILEQKGYVKHRQEGRAFLYSPCVAEDEASRSEVSHVLHRFFGSLDFRISTFLPVRMSRWWGDTTSAIARRWWLYLGVIYLVTGCVYLLAAIAAPHI